MEQPIFEKYRLIKEETDEKQDTPVKDDAFSRIEDEIKALWKENKALRGEIEGLRNESKKFTPKRKTEDGGND